MRRKLTFSLLSELIVLSMVAMPAIAENDETLGNGAPQAKLLAKLNIIGVDNPKNANMDSASGSVIFVPLTGKIAIYLTEGTDFAVLDKNGTDGRAEFQLPDPGIDPYIIGSPGDADTETTYSVFVRPLGKPGGFSTITTCAEVIQSGLEAFLGGKDAQVLNNAAELGGVASVEQVGADITTRYSSKSRFTNVTAQLLTIVLKVNVDTNGDTVLDTILYVRVPIFDPMLQNEYWEYDNHGLKLLEVRFYDVPTDVVTADGPYLPTD